MKTKATLSLAIVFVWQMNAIAAPLCSSVFTTEATTPSGLPAAPNLNPASPEEIAAALKDMAAINRMQAALAKSTNDQMGRSSFEATRQRVYEIKFYVENAMADKALKSIQSQVLQMEMIYVKMKLAEPQVLALRANPNRSITESTQLAKLEKDRRHAIQYIGKNFIEYRMLFQELGAYATQSPELAKSADYVVRNLGITKNYKSTYPALANIDRPTMSQLQDVFGGKDPNLSLVERNMALKAKLKKELRSQLISNLTRRMAGLLGDEAWNNFYQAVIGKFLEAPVTLVSILASALNHGKDEENPVAVAQNKIIGRISKASFDAYAIASHYSGAAKLQDPYMTTDKKYNLFMQLNATFGSLQDGVPAFMTTLARRPDMLPVWTELKKYIEENYPDYKMDHDRTLLQTMEKAETYRSSGLLPSVFNPSQTISYRAAKVLTIAVVSGVISYYLYNSLYADDDDSSSDDKKSEDKDSKDSTEKKPTESKNESADKTLEQMTGLSDSDLLTLLQAFIKGQSAGHAAEGSAATEEKKAD